MANLDVTDAFDPSFLSSGVVIHRIAKLDDEGVFIKTDGDKEDITAVFLPQNTKTTTAAEENEYIINSLSIFIPIKTVKLQTNITPADIILFNNIRYKVNEVDDYSYYGAGYIRITAELEDAGGTN